MPTENRSSNTEMVSVPRDWLNSVALLQMPLDELQEQAVELLCEPCDDPAPQHHADPDDYPPCDYCGITPDYHPWHGSGMINGFENRHIHACDGCRGKLPSHPGQPHPEPIAWMVGTAFWWTKEEAERDAVATGLPIVGLGPMVGTTPVEEHQGEPVARVEVGADRNACAMIIDQEWLRQLKDKAEHLVVHLYTHADPGEVERLIAQCVEKDALITEMDRIGSAKLAERDALLLKCRAWIEAARDGVLYPIARDFDGVVGRNAEGLGQETPGLLDALDAALSASAEPQVKS